MEPRIQYAKTEDGVSIAFWTMGEGTPLVHMPRHPVSHIVLEWEFPEIRRWYERLAEGRMLVRYDGRGSGLSDRDASDHSIEALVTDLETVVGHLNLQRFSLWGGLRPGPAAIAYAVRHPEHVSHLLLWCTQATNASLGESGPSAGLLALMDKDWELFTETTAHVVMGWSQGEPAHRFAAFMRAAVTQEVMRTAVASTMEFDVEALLPDVQSPTVVMHRRDVAYPGVDLAQGLASRIPGARLALLEGDSQAPYLGDPESVLAAINEFLTPGAPVRTPPHPQQVAAAVHTILFTDVEGSTALTERLGDAKARDLLREHERITREALEKHGGAEVKTLGDGFMTSFGSATAALECAITMQRAFAEHNESASEPIKVRIGLNAGEPISEDEDLFGTAVNMAARVCAKAEGGQILAPIVVRELVAGKGFLLADVGESELRGFEDPVRLYEVSWTGE